jgi:hypothetical protein
MGILFTIKCLVLRPLRMWLCSLPDRRVAVQMPLYPAHSTVTYYYCLSLFAVLKHSRHFQIVNLMEEPKLSIFKREEVGCVVME